MLSAGSSSGVLQSECVLLGRRPCRVLVHPRYLLYRGLKESMPRCAGLLEHPEPIVIHHSVHV